jgi:hypothetical protein
VELWERVYRGELNASRAAGDQRADVIVPVDCLA